MHIKTIVVYAIAKEPVTNAASYPYRFLPRVYMRKIDAVAALPELAREFMRKFPRVDDEWENPIALILRDECDIEYQSRWQPDNSIKKRTLTIEKLTVVDGRVAFNDGVKADVDDWEEVLVKDPKFKGWNAQDWIDRLYDASVNGPTEYSFQDLLERCDWWKFLGVSGENVNNRQGFVISCPWLVDHVECSGIKILSCEWLTILERHPRVAKKCKVWDEFDGGSWSELLVKKPQFASRCDWKKLQGNDWVTLLLDRPSFSVRCDWSLLSGDDWTRLLKERPEFVEFCNPLKLSNAQWTEVFQYQPQLAEKT